MKYELNLLESMVTNAGAGDPDKEAIRIKDLFINLALSHKKQNILRRYFRVHREGLESLRTNLQAGTLTKRKKSLLTITGQLISWMDEHLVQFLANEDADDPDIDARKVITSLNLQELAVLLRLYMEAGVIRVRNQKALTRFMSRNIVVRTSKVPGDFSEDHLYNAIHSPTAGALDRIQKTLNEMLTHLNKLRREKRQKERVKKD
jgi:hypothetical protein